MGSNRELLLQHSKIIDGVKVLVILFFKVQKEFETLLRNF